MGSPEPGKIQPRALPAVDSLSLTSSYMPGPGWLSPYLLQIYRQVKRKLKQCSKFHDGEGQDVISTPAGAGPKQASRSFLIRAF